MGIGPIELQGGVQRLQDFSILKHNEEMRGSVEQASFGAQLKQEINNKPSQISQSDKSSNEQKRFDARDKGSNEYAGNGGKNRKGVKSDQNTGTVVAKGKARYGIPGGSFDLKI